MGSKLFNVTALPGIIAGIVHEFLVNDPLLRYCTAKPVIFTGGAMDCEQIGRMIRYHRKRAGLSQLELANLCGIGKTAVFDVEKGKATVQLRTLMAPQEGLNISVHWRSPLMTEFLEEEKGNAQS